MRSLFGLSALLLVASLAGAARAQAPVASGAPAAAASAAPSATAALPPGHPAPTANPDDGLFRPPPDEEQIDQSLPAGIIVAQIRDAANNAMPGVDVTLGVLQQSVAKGESRKHVNQVTDARGYVHFDGLETGSGVAYRVSVAREGGSFAATPFQLDLAHGSRVVLHVYPVLRDISRQQYIATAGAMYLELKDDRLLVQQAVRVFNATPAAWVPDKLVLKLPEGFTALNGQAAMSDQGIDPVPEGARIRGTFPPGDHEIVFSWQVPYDGDPDISLDIDMPPHLSSMIVRAASAPGMQLVVDGFPAASTELNEGGQRILATTKRANDNDPPIGKLRVSLRGLPTKGPATRIVTVLALFGIVVGVYLALRLRGTTRKGEDRTDRARLLEDLQELEVARRKGDVGPRTYERAHRELIDALARQLAKKA